jgi:predicted secreted hydrolase
MKPLSMMPFSIKRGLAAVALLALLGAAPSRFEIARAPYQYAFPRDHGAHFAYQSEWWYFTGHLRSPGGRRFGFELTFFRFGIRPGLVKIEPGMSQWHGSEVYPVHFAVTDVDGKSFVHYERFARSALGMASSREGELDVAVDDWFVRGDGPIRMHAAAEGTALQLEQRPLKAPAIHGVGGISKKAACRSCASHYYSLTRLATRGTVVVAGRRFSVDGISWMDHEFGSDELQADQAGWDWFSVQLDDGRELMLYRLRQRDGSITPESSGSVVGRDGSVRHLRLADFSVEPLGSWRSPHTGGTYPSGWRVRVPSESLDVRVTPQLLDQELDDAQIGVAYWEGACDVTGTDRGAPVNGASYVELTGYAGKVRL